MIIYYLIEYVIIKASVELILKVPAKSLETLQLIMIHCKP